MPTWALATLLGTAGSIAVAGLSAIVWLLWDLNRLTATQNGSLARVIAEFDAHRAEDRQDFGAVNDGIQKVHSRIDDVLALLP